MFDDDAPVQATYSFSDIEAERIALNRSVSDVPDEVLVDFVNELVLRYEVSEETDVQINKFFKLGQLTPRGREVLTGCFLLYYGKLSMCSGGDGVKYDKLS